MADDNKPWKYARYAIGEIVLVVIGILIALQINTWNEERKNKKWEQQFLNDLRNELQNDRQQLTEVVEFQKTKKEASAEIMEILKVPNPSKKPLIDSLFHYIISGNRTFFPTSGVYDSGLSAGKIENLQNDDLKYMIMNLYNHYYKRLVYNGEIYDQRVEKIAWERKEYFDKNAQKIRSWDQITSLKFYTHIEFLDTETGVYVTLADSNLQEINNIIALINNEIQ
ncbi:DUF6090 family protein [Lutimonas vermicola]|uniref:DUF6090 family protein n=1 Tax=Lutimonas vermicola TaxID=414288 RepID=A0ABU9L0E3_9FLAO